MQATQDIRYQFPQDEHKFLLDKYQYEFKEFNRFTGEQASHLLVVNEDSAAFALRSKLTPGEHIVTHKQIVADAGNNLRNLVGDNCTAVRISFLDWNWELDQPPVLIVATVIDALRSTLEDVDISHNDDLYHEQDVIANLDFLAAALVAAEHLKTFDMVKTACVHPDELNTFIRALAARRGVTYWTESEETGSCPVECKGGCVFRAPPV